MALRAGAWPARSSLTSVAMNLNFAVTGFHTSFRLPGELECPCHRERRRVAGNVITPARLQSALAELSRAACESAAGGPSAGPRTAAEGDTEIWPRPSTSILAPRTPRVRGTRADIATHPNV